MRILIADDHALLSESLRMMLEKDEDIEVVGIAGDGLQARTMCSEYKPDIVLMDVRMPGMDGITATKLIKTDSLKTKIIILTSLEEIKWIAGSFAAGASGYILKDTPPDMLISIIKFINWGYLVSSPGILDCILNEGGSFTEYLTLPVFRDDDLQIIKYISEGMSNVEISAKMSYAVGTVKNRITKIIEMTKVENRAQLVLYALRNNLI